jgi:hypothetical protein
MTARRHIDYPSASDFRSPLHAHTAGSPCLVAVDAVPLLLGHPPTDEELASKKPPTLVPVGPGWYRCSEIRTEPAMSAGYWIHDHGARFVSHSPRRKDGCP